MKENALRKRLIRVCCFVPGRERLAAKGVAQYCCCYPMCMGWRGLLRSNVQETVSFLFVCILQQRNQWGEGGEVYLFGL